MAKAFDAKSIATDAVANSPEVTIDPTRLEASKAPAEPVAPPPPVTDVSGLDENDGRAVAYSLNAAHAEFIGDDLNPAFILAVETVAAGLFSGIRALGAPASARVGILALAITPALAVVGLRFWQKYKQGPAKVAHG